MASDKAVIVERSLLEPEPERVWRIAQVTYFDETTGAHHLRYATKWKRGYIRPTLVVKCGDVDDLNSLRYDGPETSVVLAAREYFILPRGSSSRIPKSGRSKKICRLEVGDVPHLRRSWSALSLVECMRPVELNAVDDNAIGSEPKRPDRYMWKCSVGDCEVHLFSDLKLPELPPRFRVSFSLHDKMPCIEVASPETCTLVSALRELQGRVDGFHQGKVPGSAKLYYSISPSSVGGTVLSRQGCRTAAYFSC